MLSLERDALTATAEVNDTKLLEEVRTCQSATLTEKSGRRALWHGLRAEFFAAMWKEQDTLECYAGGAAMSISAANRRRERCGLRPIQHPHRLRPGACP